MSPGLKASRVIGLADDIAVDRMDAFEAGLNAPGVEEARRHALFLSERFGEPPREEPEALRAAITRWQDETGSTATAPAPNMPRGHCQPRHSG